MKGRCHKNISNIDPNFARESSEILERSRRCKGRELRFGVHSSHCFLREGAQPIGLSQKTCSV